MLYQSLCVLVLACGVATQEIGSKRYLCALYCLLVYLGAATVPYSGGYLYFSLWELLTIMVMSLIGGRLAVIIMALCTGCIFVNMLSYWIDFYTDSTLFNEVSIGLIFAFQMACIFSRKLTDGVWRACSILDPIRRLPNLRIKTHTRGDQS